MQLLLIVILALFSTSQCIAGEIFARENLVAWCIVPFDAKKRGPEERAKMLQHLGLRRFAYDYRAEHVPTFDAEVEAMKKHGIEFFAWWFPGGLNAEAKLILDVIRRHGIKPQLWVMGGGANPDGPEAHAKRIAEEVARLAPIVQAADEVGCKVALYNHGGWFGEPENQIAVINALRVQGIRNVGIVYNLHHGHAHLARLAELLSKMKPHLLALNLNGMFRDGDKVGKKIAVIGEGSEDARVLTVIQESGWHGPIGILNHTEEDAEARLRANLDGLDRLRKATGH